MILRKKYVKEKKELEEYVKFLVKNEYFDLKSFNLLAKKIKKVEELFIVAAES